MFIYSQLVLMIFISLCLGEDYYKLLGIDKSANNREIRKAFKKLAVILHPDKNQEDPDVHDKFVRLTKAYEVLKDDETRKKYDLYGEEGIKSTQQQSYHSWSYYQNNFGIYDDDPEIITLSTADFEQSVVNSNDLWFINFYSPMCSHCHHLAPEWRRLALALEGVIRVGAINCDEDWGLCRQENVRSYPSLVMYPAREHYDGDRHEDEMTRFVLGRLRVQVAELSLRSWETLANGDQSWVVFLCRGGGTCSEPDSLHKLAAILDGLVSVGAADCELDSALCEKLGGKADVVYWEPSEQVPMGLSHIVTVTGAKEIAKQILGFLPEMAVLDQEGFEDMRTRLLLGSTAPWLVYFHLGESSEEDLELRKLPALLPTMRLGKVNCGRHPEVCADQHVQRYPTFAVFKAGGAHEVHHGRESAHDVANFARESGAATNLRTLTPDQLLQEELGGPWLVDFYAPWCPPCLRLLPEFRKASRQFGLDSVKFGTVDCTIHAVFCRSRNIRSYPTTVLYNASRSHQFHGDPTATGLVDFVQDMLHPSVTKLNEELFQQTVGRKTPGEIWLVDFFAPWCGPCQQLAPQWRKLAKMISDLKYIHVGEVDCETEYFLCSQHGVRSYPTIRLYPLGGQGLSTVAIYSGFQRDAKSLRSWLYNFLPSLVEELTPDMFKDHVLDGHEPWLVDFYAPWCGHCVSFAPEFQMVAQKLEERVRCGKINCDAYRHLCQQAGVTGYPSVLFYQRGARRGEDIPSQSGDFIVKHVESTLANHRLPRDEF